MTSRKVQAAIRRRMRSADTRTRRSGSGGYEYQADQTGMPDGEVAARVAAAKAAARARHAQDNPPAVEGVP